MWPMEGSRKGREVSMVSLMSGMAAVLMNFMSVIQGCEWKTSSSRYRAALILSASGRKSMKRRRMELSMAISMSLLRTAIPLAQLPNNFICML